MATKPKPKPGIFHIGDGSHLIVKSSTVVEMRDHLKLMIGDNKSEELDVVIKADFEKLPPQYHHLFMQMMSVRYGGIVNICGITLIHLLSRLRKKEVVAILEKIVIDI